MRATDADPDRLASWRIATAGVSRPVGGVAPLIGVLIESLVDVVAVAVQQVHLLHLADGVPVGESKWFLDDVVGLAAAGVRSGGLGELADSVGVDLGGPVITDVVVGVLAELAGLRAGADGGWAGLVAEAMGVLRGGLYGVVGAGF